MKQILTFLFILTTTLAISQTPYDSTENYLWNDDPQRYIGQEFYLVGKIESHRRVGYQGFFLDYTRPIVGNTDNVYKCCDNYIYSRYDDLNERYFKVLDVIMLDDTAENRQYSKWFIKLEEKESKDILYYMYDENSKAFFPFLVVGYLEKQKKRFIGKKMEAYDRTFGGLLRGSNDIITGKPITTEGQNWTCTDLTLDQHYKLSFVVTNGLGEQGSYDFEKLMELLNW